MRNPDLSLPTNGPISRWQMPIHPERYRDRHPHLTEEEKALMQQYATAPTSFMTGGRARNVLHRLERFEAPFLDIVRLTSPMDTTVTAARRYLFSWMVQKEQAFWAWPQDIWVEVIQHAPGVKHTSGTRFWMLLLAYLFCDVLYIGASTVYGTIAELIFGKSVVATEVNKVRTPLVEAGYAADQKEGGRLQWVTALCMLVNRHPSIEAFSSHLLTTVYELLPQIEGAAQDKGRWALMRLQTSLCHLGVLDEPVILDTSHEKAAYLPALWQNAPTVDPTWLAWVGAFYDQTPAYDERRRRQMCYSLLIAGRWLKQYHPEVREPADWTEALAVEYVTYTRPGQNLAICWYQQIPDLLASKGFLNNSAPGPLTGA